MMRWLYRRLVPDAALRIRRHVPFPLVLADAILRESYEPEIRRTLYATNVLGERYLADDEITSS